MGFRLFANAEFERFNFVGCLWDCRSHLFGGHCQRDDHRWFRHGDYCSGAPPCCVMATSARCIDCSNRNCGCSWWVSRDVLGPIAVVVGGTGIVPQAIRAARTTHLVGVSVATFAMVVVMSVSWGVYGLMIGDFFVAMPNVVIVPSALFIMLRALQSHNRYGKTTDATAVPAR